MKSIELHKSIARRIYAEIWSQGAVQVVDDVFAPALAFDAGDGMPEGREGFKSLVHDWRSGFPDMREDVLDIIAEDDRLACRFRLTGTQTGAFLGRPATGRAVAIEGIDLYRFERGRIVAFSYQEDTMGLYRQLGWIEP